MAGTRDATRRRPSGGPRRRATAVAPGTRTARRTHRRRWRARARRPPRPRCPGRQSPPPSRSTPCEQVPRFGPIARRMPNSRVRALTENASTPATPTTAIVSATPAKPPNTSAFRRSGASTSARTSSSVAGRSTGWSGSELRMMRVIGDQRVRVGRGVHEQPPAADLLLERVVHRHRRSRHDVLVVHVGGDADDAARRWC
jgi:hypothetical protein